MTAHDPLLCYPILPPCSSGRYTPRPCPRAAAVRLFVPEGRTAVGGEFCDMHGKAIVEEFRIKAQEIWTIKPIHRYTHTSCAG